MLLSGSPLLHDISRDALVGLFEKLTPIQRRYALQRLSQALHHLGFIEAPLQHGWSLPRSGQSPDLAANVDKRWARYVERWFSTSTLAPGTRTEVRYMLLKVGRWVTATHPEVASPELWTRETAAKWVAAVCRMRVGEWHNQVRRIAEHGKPLSPTAMMGHCGMLRVFFRDCQEWEWFPRRFDPRRCLRAPASVRRLIGPNPRVIADDVWAKLVWSGLNLTQADLPQGSTIFYPVEMIRALALVWLFGGLRSDEISRLRVGAIRWKEPTEGDNSSVRVCLLDVPVNKTSTAFVKPVDPMVGEAIEAWEKVRPRQPAPLDHKTGDLAHFIFAYRARPLGDRYLNRMLIPLLCKKAGVPREDARGKITSPRGRSTIASQLYNAKQPLSLFELQAWLGHGSPNATQYYAKITPTKLSKRTTRRATSSGTCARSTCSSIRMPSASTCRTATRGSITTSDTAIAHTTSLTNVSTAWRAPSAPFTHRSVRRPPFCWKAKRIYCVCGRRSHYSKARSQPLMTVSERSTSC